VRLLRGALRDVFDVRRGEIRICVHASIVFFLIIAGHTVLETVRDTLLLAQLPLSRLNLMYVSVAGLTFLVNAVASGIARRLGHRRTLVGLLVFAACASSVLRFLPSCEYVACTVYLVSGLLVTVLASQFWLHSAQLLTREQGGRLFSLIATGGTAGGILGAELASHVLRCRPVMSLLPLAAACFLLGALALCAVQSEDAPASPSQPRDNAASGQSYVARVVGLVLLSTAALLIVDYLFKSTIAARIPASRLGPFFAHFYAAMNVISLGVQLVGAPLVLRRFGVVGAACIMPALLVIGGGASLLGGGSWVFVLGLKAVDAGLRFSLNRVTIELMYLWVPDNVRARARGVVECVVSRVVQAGTGGLLYYLAVRTLATPGVLALLVIAVSLAWALLVLSLRRPHRDLGEPPRVNRSRLDSSSSGLAGERSFP